MDKKINLIALVASIIFLFVVFLIIVREGIGLPSDHRLQTHSYSIAMGTKGEEKFNNPQQSLHVMLEPKFSAEGLNYEIELTDIFIGNFSALPWKREDLMFGVLYNLYISSFGKYCDNYLPKNKIALTYQECVEKYVTKNGYGQIISESCTKWETRPTGYYAAPDMYAAKEVLDGFQLEGVIGIMGTKDPLGGSVRMAGETKAIALDIPALIRMNGCDSEGLKQFQENLKRLALNKDPIRIEAAIAKRAARAEISSNQDWEKLLEDLVMENSRQWVINRYQPGSVSNVQKLSEFPGGIRSKLKATYRYKGWGGNATGSVIVTFTEKGLPDCLYFSDFPNTCRPVSRKIVTAFSKNEYAR